jgi:hypothetical protein
LQLLRLSERISPQKKRAMVPEVGRRLHRVLRDLPEELATYKGFARNRPMIVEYLSKFDDGAATSPGIYAD